MRYLRAAAAIVAMLINVSAAAEDNSADTAGYLCDQCASTTGNQIYCLGYLKGVLDTVNTEVAAKVRTPFYCAQPGTAMSDFKSVWDKYCALHPQDREVRAASAFASAISETFPCAPPDAKTGR